MSKHHGIDFFRGIEFVGEDFEEYRHEGDCPICHAKTDSVFCDDDEEIVGCPNCLEQEEWTEQGYYYDWFSGEWELDPEWERDYWLGEKADFEIKSRKENSW